MTDGQCRIWKTGQFCCKGGQCCHEKETENQDEATFSGLNENLEDKEEGHQQDSNDGSIDSTTIIPNEEITEEMTDAFVKIEGKKTCIFYLY